MGFRHESTHQLSYWVGVATQTMGKDKIVIQVADDGACFCVTVHWTDFSYRTDMHLDSIRSLNFLRYYQLQWTSIASRAGSEKFCLSRIRDSSKSNLIEMGERALWKANKCDWTEIVRPVGQFYGIESAMETWPLKPNVMNLIYIAAAACSEKPLGQFSSWNHEKRHNGKTDHNSTETTRTQILLELRKKTSYNHSLNWLAGETAANMRVREYRAPNHDVDSPW